MTCVNGQIAIVESVGYGLRGDFPLGGYVPTARLTTLTFDGVDGSVPDAPLVNLTGNWQVLNNKVTVQGAPPPNTIGYKIGSDTGLSDGVMRLTYNAEGEGGSEAGPVPRYVGTGDFMDIVNLNGSFQLVNIENNAIVGALGAYSIPNYDNTADYQLDVVRNGDNLKFYVDNILAIDYTGAPHAAATTWGFKSDGGGATFDNLVLPNAVAPEIDEANYFVFGHSLFTYDGGDDAPVTDYTRSGTWIGLFGQEESIVAKGGGVFGQIGTINNAFATNFYDGVDGMPASDQLNYRYSSNTPASPEFYPIASTFEEEKFSHIIFMASNFEQDVPPAGIIPGFATLVDNVRPQSNNSEFLMYIHWPEPNLAGNFGAADDLTRAEWTVYNDYMRDKVNGANTDRGYYITWHLDWYNAILVNHPNLKMRCIPVGPIVADLCEDVAFFSTVVYTDLNGDTSPHPTDSMSLLAGLITYMTMYQRNPDLSSFTIPPGATIIPEITNNLTAIVSFIRQRLDHYNDNGIKVY